MHPRTPKQSVRTITLLIMLLGTALTTLVVGPSGDAHKRIEPRVNHGAAQALALTHGSRPLFPQAPSPSPTPPEIVYKLRGLVCQEAFGGVGGSTMCNPLTAPQETTNANLSLSITDPRRDSSLNVTVLPTETSNSLQANMGARLHHEHAGGPAFITSAKAFLDVEVYVKDTPDNIYTIVISNGSSASNQFTHPPRSGGFGCPCGTQNAVGSATAVPGLTLYGTASQLGSQGMTFPEWPGVNYKLAYQRNPNDWDYIASASGGINDWDFDADLWADAFLSLNIFATSQCIRGIQLVCNPIANPLGAPNLSCPKFVAKHCFFVVSFPDGVKETFGAYDFGDLTPQTNYDPIPSPNACIADDLDMNLSKPFCKDLTPVLVDLCDAFRILNDAYRQGSAGTYNQATNNSDKWVRKRLDDMGLTTLLLPPSAPIDLGEYCTQKDRMTGIAASECDYEAQLRNRIFGGFFIERCP